MSGHLAVFIKGLARRSRHSSSDNCLHKQYRSGSLNDLSDDPLNIGPRSRASSELALDMCDNKLKMKKQNSLRRAAMQNAFASQQEISCKNDTSVDNSKVLESLPFIRELIEKMITQLQLLERKNQELEKGTANLTIDNLSLQTDLQKTKVELSLYKSKTAELERLANSWRCPICNDNRNAIKKANRQVMMTPCEHFFCSSCLNASILKSKLCPNPVCDKIIHRKDFVNVVHM